MTRLITLIIALVLVQNTVGPSASQLGSAKRPRPDVDRKMVIPAPPAHRGMNGDPGMLKRVPPAPQDPATPGLRPA